LNQKTSLNKQKKGRGEAIYEEKKDSSSTRGGKGVFKQGGESKLFLSGREGDLNQGGGWKMTTVRGDPNLYLKKRQKKIFWP